MGTLVLTCYCDLSIGVDKSNQDTAICKVYSFSIIPDVPAFAQFLSLIAFLSVLFLYMSDIFCILTTHMLTSLLSQDGKTPLELADNEEVKAAFAQQWAWPASQ